MPCMLLIEIDRCTACTLPVLPSRPLRTALMHALRTRRIALSLYLSGLSSRDVSRRLSEEYGTKVTPQTVAQWARKLAMSHPKGGKRFRLSGEDLEPLYRAGASISQLANRYHVSQTLVGGRLHEAGTVMRRGGTIYELLTADLLRELYWDRGLSAKQIAGRVGCSQATIHYRLRAYGIPRKRKR